MAMSNDEMRMIAKLAVQESDLETVKAMSELRVETIEARDEARGARREVKQLRDGLPDIIKNEVTDKIAECRAHQENRRRWNTGNILIIIGIGSSFGVGLAALIG